MASCKDRGDRPLGNSIGVLLGRYMVSVAERFRQQIVVLSNASSNLVGYPIYNNDDVGKWLIQRSAKPSITSSNLVIVSKISLYGEIGRPARLRI